MWVLAIVVYLIGASIMVRRQVLQLYAWTEKQAKESCRYCRDTVLRYCKKHDSEVIHARAAVVWKSLLWPLVLVVWGWWKLLFPRGVRTRASIKEARAAALDAKNKALVTTLEQQAKKIKELSRAAGLRIPEGL